MLKQLLTLLTLSLLSIFIVGCGPGIHRDRVTILPCNTKGHDGCPTLQADTPILVEYLQAGSAWFTGGSLYYHTDGMILSGKVKAPSFTALLPSKAIKVEALTCSNEIAWTGLTTIQREHSFRMNRNRKGSFEIHIPTDVEVDHLHVGIVSRSHSDAVLPIECLAKKDL